MSTSEICGDISSANRLNAGEKISYLARNLLRGVIGYVSFARTKHWQGKIEARGTSSPARTYVDAWLKHGLLEVVPPGNVRILDIGCGSGYLRPLISKHGYSGEYVGVDISRHRSFDSFIDEAFHSKFIESGIETADVGTEYDLVISNTAFEHITNDRDAACKSYAALREGGVGIHIVPSFWGLFLYLFHGYRQYSPRRIEKVFRGMPHQTYRLGGFASFILHIFVVTFWERVFGLRSVRNSGWYPKILVLAARVDRYLPFCSGMYVIVVKKTSSMNPRRSRILFALPSLIAIGGIERQLAAQLPRYDRARFKLAVMTLFSYGDRELVTLPHDVHHEQIGFMGRFDLRGWRRMIRYLRAYDPDVVVTSMFSANTALRVLKPFFRYRVISREHNTYEEKNIMQRFLDHILSYISCRIVAVSEGVADFASKQARISRGKFQVIQNGIDIEAIDAWLASQPEREILRSSLGFASTDQIILTVGRIKKTKNQTTLVQAFATYAKQNPRARLVIIGDGSERLHLEEIIDSVKPGRIELIQRQGREVWPYYAVADFFILPSLREGFPNVILEAMAFGLPILATPVSGSTECVTDGENGLLFSPSVSSISDALGKALEFSEERRLQFSKKARERAELFSLARTVTRYEKIFLACIPSV